MLSSALQANQADPPSWVHERLIFAGTTAQLAQVILNFGECLCGLRLYRYQRLFAFRIVMCVLKRDGKEVTALFSRQSGKTEAVAVVALALAVLLPVLARLYPDDERVSTYRNGFRVGIYGPKDRQAKIAFDRIRKYGGSDRAEMLYAEPDIGIELIQSRGDSLAWSNGSHVLSETASDATDNEGQTWDLVIADESQKLSKNKLRKELSATLAATNGPMVLIGTANASKGYFFHTIEDNLASERVNGDRLHFEYNYEQVLAEKAARYQEETVQYQTFLRMSPQEQARALALDPGAGERPNPFHMNYAQFIARELAKVRGNTNDEAFRMNFRLKWQDNRSIAVPETVWNAAAIPSLELNQDGAVGFLVASLDVAKGATEKNDKSVLTVEHVDIENPIVDQLVIPVAGKKNEPIIHYNKTVIGVYSFQGSFEHVQYAKIVSIVRRYPTLRFLLCDSTGMGDPVCERLQVLLHWITVEGYNISMHSKSRLYKRFLEEVHAGRFRYAAGPETQKSLEYEEMCEQVTNLQREGLESGLIKCYAPEGDNDDYPDALALGSMAADMAVGMSVVDPAVVEVSTWSTGPNSAKYSDSHTRVNRYRSGRRNGGNRRRQHLTAA